MGREWDRLDRVPVSDQPGYVERGRITEREEAVSAYSGAGGRAVNSYQAGRPMQAWHERWAREALRVLKPGGHLLAFGGTRTYHRLVCAIEDAGFEIRDRVLYLNEAGERCETLGAELDWLYGSGFPKSLNISKAIDGFAGAEREVVGRYTLPADSDAGNAGQVLRATGEGVGYHGGSGPFAEGREITAPATPDAEKWEGWGTALKPAHEPIVVARKPVPATIVANVLRHGTGALNIAAGRIGINGGARRGPGDVDDRGEPNTVLGAGLDLANAAPRVEGLGRWPANVVVSHAAGCRLLGTARVRSAMGVSGGNPDGNGIFSGSFPRGDGRTVGYGDEDGMEVVEAWECADGCPIKALDEQSGATGAAAPASGPTLRGENTSVARGRFAGLTADRQPAFHGDAGGASRFYYQAGDEPERWECVEGCPVRELDEQTSHLHTAGNHPESMGGEPDGSKSIFGIGMRGPSTNYADSGGASRFFYVPKASPAERNAGLDDFELQPGPSEDYGTKRQHPMKPEGEPNIVRATRNPHPTVKPIELMRWLLRLVTPPGGIVLDPFAGSGSTGCAAALEDIAFIGIERDPEFVPLARARVAWWRQQPKHTPVEPLLEAEAKRRVVRATGQASLFG